jgi:hypothetical protein
MSKWAGPAHYVPLQRVVNETSQSTPFRIVTNTSCKDPKPGKLLNSITAKGPNMLSDAYRILLCFRNRKYAISTDVEMHLRRVIYRCKSSEEWKTYGFLCVSFGDVAAQAILDGCLKRLEKIYKEDKP